MPKYTEFDILPDGNLRISLTEDGKQEWADIQARYTGTAAFADLAYWVEYQLCNGWEFVDPATIGALTSAPILSDDILVDDIGEVVSVGRVFWYPDYAIRNPVDVLLRDGSVTFRKGE